MAKFSRAQEQMIELIRSEAIPTPKTKESLVSMLLDFAELGAGNHVKQASAFVVKRSRGAPPKHPFAVMEVGDEIHIYKNKKYLQAYCHVYGRSSGKKFKTRTNECSRTLYIKRVA